MATIIYTDGACRRNPGPGGYAAVIVRDGASGEEIGGHEPDTTNNRMELRAAIEALRRLGPHERATVRSDSEYVVKGVSSWVAGWRRRGWKTREGGDVLNRDLWEELAALAGRRARFEHVRGHAGDALNERCDRLARAFAEGKSPELAPAPAPAPPSAPPGPGSTRAPEPALDKRSTATRPTKAARLLARRADLMRELGAVQAELFGIAPEPRQLRS